MWTQIFRSKVSNRRIAKSLPQNRAGSTVCGSTPLWPEQRSLYPVSVPGTSALAASAGPGSRPCASTLPNQAPRTPGSERPNPDLEPWTFLLRPHTTHLPAQFPRPDKGVPSSVTFQEGLRRTRHTHLTISLPPSPTHKPRLPFLESTPGTPLPGPRAEAQGTPVISSGPQYQPSRGGYILPRSRILVQVAKYEALPAHDSTALRNPPSSPPMTRTIHATGPQPSGRSRKEPTGSKSSGPSHERTLWDCTQVPDPSSPQTPSSPLISHPWHCARVLVRHPAG